LARARSWLRKALTKKKVTKPDVSRRVIIEEVQPSERLVLAVAVTIVAVTGLTILEIVYIIYFKAWNNEIFTAITGLVGLVVGTLIGAQV
jgi:hypothetical protein